MVKGKYLNLIISNIRHSKWQVAAIAVLLVIASALINIFLLLSSDYQANFYREKARLNGEDIDVLIMNNAQGEDCFDSIDETLSELSQIKAYEIDRVMTGPGSVEYGDGILSNNITFMHYGEALEKHIGTYEILESNQSEGVYLSYLFKVDGGYRIGQNISITLGPETYTFEIAGFYNNIDTGTSNCTDFVVLLTENCYNDIVSDAAASYRISLLLNEPEQADVLESGIAEKITEGRPFLTFLASSTHQKLSASRYVTATIFRAIISVSTILMIAVILATIAVTLSNYIHNNIKSLGTLKALGYSSNNLIFPIAGEFAGIALFMALVGVAISYAFFPILNEALERQVGIPYKIHFLAEEAVWAVVICVITSELSAFLSVLRIKRIEPINAIREMKSKKRVHRNFFALDKTRAGLNTAISLKMMVNDKTHGIILFLAMTVIAFLLGFSAFTYQNVILDQNAILDLVCGQRTDSVISVYPEFEDTLLFELEENRSVERYYFYSVFPVTPLHMPKIFANIIDDEYEAKENVIVEGHLPQNDREMAINSAYARNYDLAVGDKISFENDEEVVKFTICGLTQGALHAGRDCCLTRDGYSRISEMPYVSYYIDLKENIDIETFNSEISENCPVMNSSDFEKYIESVSESYVLILISATIVVVLLSFVIAAFILYILISINIANRRREHGILKSLGFASKDIIYQTVFCNMPSCVLGTIIGLFLSRNGAGKLITTALSVVGIFSFGTPTRAAYLVVAGVALIVFAVLFSILLSNSVRKITLHELFNQE